MRERAIWRRRTIQIDQSSSGGENKMLLVCVCGKKWADLHPHPLSQKRKRIAAEADPKGQKRVY